MGATAPPWIKVIFLFQISGWWEGGAGWQGGVHEGVQVGVRGCRVVGMGCRVLGRGCRLVGMGCRVVGMGCRVA